MKIAITYPSHSLTLLQKGGLWHILFGFIPLASTSRLFPLIITKDRASIGRSEIKSDDNASYFHIESLCYELRGHTDDKFSICKDGIQIAVIQKEHYSYAEKNTYLILTSENTLEDVAYLFMLCMYIDCRFYRSQDNSFAMMKWEKTFVLHDLYKERAEWLP